MTWASPFPKHGEGKTHITLNEAGENILTSRDCQGRPHELTIAHGYLNQSAWTYFR